MNINEQIHIEPHNPKWHDLYEKEIHYLKQIQELSYLKFEHIGSTSIPNIKAKPIIDILVGVKIFPVSDAVIETLKKAAYIYMQEGSVADRLYFIKRGEVNYNIQIVVYGGHIWIDDLLFRDYLTDNPHKALEYQRVKERIIGSGTKTLLEYSALKADIITAIYAEIHSNDNIIRHKSQCSD
jgi:GrpB-like predicted nucleotidyltransferase (UPF0157 family)